MYVCMYVCACLRACAALPRCVLRAYGRNKSRGRIARRARALPQLRGLLTHNRFPAPFPSSPSCARVIAPRAAGPWRACAARDSARAAAQGLLATVSAAWGPALAEPSSAWGSCATPLAFHTFRGPPPRPRQTPRQRREECEGAPAAGACKPARGFPLYSPRARAQSHARSRMHSRTRTYTPRGRGKGDGAGPGAQCAMLM